MTRARLCRLFALSVMVSLTLAACGDDDAASSEVDPTTTSTTSTSTTGPGADESGPVNTTIPESDAEALTMLPEPDSCDDLLAIIDDGVEGFDPGANTGTFELVGADVDAGSFDLNLHDPDDGDWRLIRVRDGVVVATVTSSILAELEDYVGRMVVAGELIGSGVEVSDCFGYIYGSS